jgi:hypothetical protein
MYNIYTSFDEFFLPVSQRVEMNYIKIVSVMVSVLASSAIDCGYGERAKTAWLGIRIMCLIGATYLPNDCC